MQYRITAEVVHETSGEYFNIDFYVDDLDFNGEKPTEDALIESIVSNLSVVITSVDEED